jgi:hypothetical protein
MWGRRSLTGLNAILGCSSSIHAKFTAKDRTLATSYWPKSLFPGPWFVDVIYGEHMARNLSILVIALALASCAQDRQHAKVPEQAGPVIVRIVSRDATITARAGNNGAIYTVQSKSGEQTIPSMTMPQLEAQHPQLARHIQTMEAGAWAGVE